MNIKPFLTRAANASSSAVSVRSAMDASAAGSLVVGIFKKNGIRATYDYDSAVNGKPSLEFTIPYPELRVARFSILLDQPGKFKYLCELPSIEDLVDSSGLFDGASINEVFDSEYLSEYSKAFKATPKALKVLTSKLAKHLEFIKAFEKSIAQIEKLAAKEFSKSK